MEKLEKQIEKQMKEGKERERNMFAEIRNLKLKRSLKKRDQIGEMNQPAHIKKRIVKEK